jgi:predicted nucleic acid-binding protein
MILALDSSFLVKLIFEEEYSDKASEIIHDRQARYPEYIASDLVVYELGNVIWKKLKNHADRGMVLLDRVMGMNIQLKRATPDVLSRAMKFSMKESVSYYDAIHLAVADIHSANLITEDQMLLDRFDFTMSIHSAADLMCE